MAIYTNVVREYRQEIEHHLKFDDIIDIFVANLLINQKTYFEIWSYQNNHVNHLLDLVLKDGKLCDKFIEILGNIEYMRQISNRIRADVEGIRKMVILGGFPEFSLNYVVRNSVANVIERKAFELNPLIGGTLVVHGLPGFGKSCLVNQVLQTRRFLEASGGAMFWINLGEHSDTTMVINPLWNLYLNAIKLTEKTPLSHRPEDIHILQDELRRLFLEDQLKKSFIILDDVKSAAVLKVFKLRCKLIVTTQDKNVASNSEAFFVKVTTGFTQKESLELLRKSLDTRDLSSKEKFAYKIHELCDGCPMLLNIIGSILRDSREETLSSDKIWESIIDDIRLNDSLKHPTTMNVIHMIQKFVTCLPSDVQKYFHSLAVFPKHVNIRPEILMKLWNQSYAKVRQVMVELENKSLVVSFYNTELQIYIYSIHSLVRTYLVEVAQTDVKQYHRKLISQFEDVLSKPHTDDPSANYIFGYYGYHAKNGDLFDKFDIYFDLNFIENKIKRVGSTDLLTDFDVYREYITRKDLLLERKLEDYKKFVNSYSAHLHCSPETNIIQFAFFNDNNYVYEEARVIAENNPDQLYFKLDHYSGKNKKSVVLKVRERVTATCFVDAKELLVGSSNGVIETKSFRQYQHRVYPFEGHTNKITYLQVSDDKKSFISIAADGFVKLWRFADDLDPQSPKYKQRFWRNLHSPDETMDQHKTFRIEDDHIISASFPNDSSDEIVTASNKGRVVRWHTRSGAILKQSANLGMKITRIRYSHDDRKIICLYDGKIFLYTTNTLTYEGQFGILDPKVFNELLLVPIIARFNGVVAISGKHVEIWDYIGKKKKSQFDAIENISCAVVQDNCLGFGTATCIFIYDFDGGSMTPYGNDYGVQPTALYIQPDRIAFIGSKENTIQRCDLYFEPTEKPIVRDLALFGCYWKESLPIYFIVNQNNKIDIFNGHSTILSQIDEIHERITTAKFSLCGKYIVLGTEEGYIYFYNYKKNNMNKLKMCSSAISLIKIFECEDNVVPSDSHNLYGLVVAVSDKKIVIIHDKDIKFEFVVAKPVKHVFYLCNRLITIDADSNILVRELFNEENIWITEKSCDVIMADTHKVNRLLAVAGKENNLYILEVYKLLFNDLKTMRMEAVLDGTPKYLSFSSSGNVVAVGLESGNIEIYNLETKTQDVLALHKRSVERVLFASNVEPILVSVGDQIAWWNLKSFCQTNQENLPKNGVDHVKHRLSFLTLDNWTTKKLHDTVPYLVTSTNLNGKQLKYITASKDFRSFLIVDEDGNIFKMDIINS